MKVITIVLICLSAFVVTIYAQYEVNVEEILNNKRLLDAYTKCYLDRGPCPGPARESKKKLGEVFTTNCAKCNKKQRQDTRAALRKLRERKPQLFLEIFEKYDAGSKHLDGFLIWLKKND
uniref:Putative chemosensory protein n=1 Tax=Triatoma brasiliensis TaxID=65344 RepID=A0A162X6C2_TRIBS|nr:putative chemosensory protein [Triatoma brasiliensis]